MYKSKQRGNAELLVTIFLAVLFGLIAWATAAISCSYKWEDSGLASSYGIFSGCRVKMPDGRWLPAERVREIEITPRAAK